VREVQAAESPVVAGAAFYKGVEFIKVRHCINWSRLLLRRGFYDAALGKLGEAELIIRDVESRVTG